MYLSLLSACADVADRTHLRLTHMPPILTPLMPRLVIMAKRPELGRVKTRLAKGIGAVAAPRLYRQTSQTVIRRLSADPRWQTWLSVAPDHAVDDGGLSPMNLPHVVQGQGDIGERMQQIMGAMPRGPVVIIGSDIPEILSDHIAAAFRDLGRTDAVFGPADDGGYWLVGLRRRPRVVGIFKDVRWSGEHALADTVANVVRAGLSYEMGARLSDVDTADDYLRWQARSR